MDLVPTVPVKGTNGKLMTGLVYKIKGTHNPVLDDWSGKTGKHSAALQPDNQAFSENRIWEIV
jgi:hypothetical protein